MECQTAAALSDFALSSSSTVFGQGSRHEWLDQLGRAQWKESALLRPSYQSHLAALLGVIPIWPKMPASSNAIVWRATDERISLPCLL